MWSLVVVESSHPAKHRQAQWLLTQVLARRHKERATNKLRPSVRVGLSGPPGAGKSTLIERLGLHLLSLGHRVAVLVRRVMGWGHGLVDLSRMIAYFLANFGLSITKKVLEVV